MVTKWLIPGLVRLCIFKLNICHT